MPILRSKALRFQLHTLAYNLGNFHANLGDA
jgi:hypothetical protein